MASPKIYYISEPWARSGMRIPLDLGLSREQRLAELRRDLVNAACLHGEFVLSSGVESTVYFDKYLFETKPGVLRRTANLLAELVPPEADRLAGSELGGVPLATAVALETGLPFLILRKPGNGHHRRMIEGESYATERFASIGLQLKALFRLSELGI